jgi:hypothetical protein
MMRKPGASQQKPLVQTSARIEITEPVKDKDPRLLFELSAVAVLLLILALQLFLSGRLKSATMDEQNHIARGIAYLRTGDVRLNREHPPFIEAICALPLAFDHSIQVPFDSVGWRTRDWYRFAEEFLWQVNPNGPAIVNRARLPIIVLTLLLGITCYLWGRELFGVMAGLATLTMLTFSPNILAHGTLATNDLGLALFSTLALYLFWRMQRQRTWLRTVLAGAALGLALVAKFSAVFLLPTILLIAGIAGWLHRRELRDRKAWLNLLAHYGVFLFTCVLVIWAIYGFRVGPLEYAGFAFPAPDYIDGLRAIIQRADKGNRAYLMGEYSTTGWWYYFPLAFLFKTPLPVLLLVCTSCLFTIRQRTYRVVAPILIPVVIYFAISLTSSLNIGYRHLLPTLPLLLIFAGQTFKVLQEGQKRWRFAFVIPLLWLAIGTLLIYPDYLAYFNELVGGPKNGYKLLADSNLDWGQELIRLRDYMNKENIQSVKLSYFGSAYPEKYGVVHEPLPGYPRFMGLSQATENVLKNPPPGVYAISVTNLQGIFFSNPNLYSWFRNRQPDAIIGYSIFIYKVNESLP